MITDILSSFSLEGCVESVKPLGNGLIHSTYKVTTAGDAAPDYVLQRINHDIFKDVAMLQKNIVAVTRHIRAKLEAAGETDIGRKVLRFIPLKGSSQTWCEADGGFWRVSVFIPDAYTFDTVDPVYSECAGQAFGRFEAQLADLPDQLGETIPGFHNMEFRFRQLSEAVERNAAGRLDGSGNRAVLEEMLRHREEMCLAERLYREGKLPKRICHCDTKVNNMMFDAEGRVLCVIDLDTVMPGFVFSDYGDFLRTAANTVAEDEPAIEKVAFRKDIFEAFTRGYLSSASAFLTPLEKQLLPYGVQLFPFMQAVRFFTDYLDGDTYYKIRYPEHNLVRTRNQLALFHRVQEQKEYMQQYIANFV